MVDTPKENNGENQQDAMEDDPLEKQPKRRRQRRRSKPHHSKNSDTGTRKNNSLDDAQDPADPAMEQDEQGDDKHSPGPLSDHRDAEDKNYKPVSEEENSPDDDAHIIPERHLEQGHLHKRLIATTRSLK